MALCNVLFHFPLSRKLYLLFLIYHVNLRYQHQFLTKTELGQIARTSNFEK